MKKRTLSILGAALLTASLAACAGGGASPGTGDNGASGAGRLTVYTASPKDVYEAAVTDFEQQTGIDVEVVSAGTGELVKRIQAEGSNPLADVMWGGRQSALSSALDSFEEYVSPNDEQVAPEYRNTSGTKKLTPYSIQVNALFVNNELAQGLTIDGWESLANPELKGKIAYADPAKSSSALEQMTNMIFAMGKGDPDGAGWQFIERFAENLDGKLQGSSTNAYKTVADGEYTVGLTSETNGIKYVQQGAPVTLVYPKEGIVIKADNVALIKGAKNPENAKKFIDFLTSKEYQSTMEDLGLRTVRTDVELKTFQPLEDIPTAQDDPQWLEENEATLKEKFADIYTR